MVLFEGHLANTGLEILSGYSWVKVKVMLQLGVDVRPKGVWILLKYSGL